MKLVISILIIAVIFVVALRLVSRKLLYFPVPLDRGRQEYLTKLDPSVKEIAVTAQDGISLHGWIIEKDTEKQPFIFYFGGNAEEVSLNIEDYLEKVAANVVLFNYRGYGLSGGRPSEDLLKQDALLVFDEVSKLYGIKPENSMAWGRSLGSSIASYLVLQRNLGGLILTCPFDSIEAVAANFYPAFLVSMVLTDRHRTIDFAGNIDSRALILAASEDEIIPMVRTQVLYDSLTALKKQVVIKNAGHNTISEFRGYYEAVNEFIGNPKELKQ